MELSVLNLFSVLFVAWFAGQLATRMGYPSVLGELMAGIIFGPPLLGLLHGSEAIAVLAELGILVMMLYIGMEIDPAELGKASTGGLLASLGGFITPFVLCYVAIIWWGGTQLAAVFVGVAAGVTSLATKSRILVDLQLLDTRIAHVMMAGALVADTLSLVIFAAIIGVAEAGIINMQAIGVTFLQAIAFFVLAWLAGTKLLPPVGRWLEDVGTTPTFMAIILIGLIFAEGAELAGMHGVLGAFMAGLFLREEVFGRTLSERLMDLVEHVSIGFLAPIFFVTAGFAVSLDVFTTDLTLLVAIVLLATVGKIVGTALFYLPTGYGWREGLVLGAGMNGRGAVEIIVAQIALSYGLISQDIFSILVFMAIATTATVPLLLKWGVTWLRGRDELVRSQAEREGVVIVGAGATARAMGRMLGESQPVWMVDRNGERCEMARKDGLNAVEGDGLDERVLAEAQASHAQTFLAMTSNPEVNALSARLAREVFLIPEVHLLKSGDEADRQAVSTHVGGTTLFAEPIDIDDWDYHIEHAMAETHNRAVTGPTAAGDIVRDVDSATPTIPIALRREERYLPFHSGSSLEAGDHAFLLQMEEVPTLPRDRFDRLVENADVLDIDRAIEAEEFFRKAADRLASQLNVERGKLTSGFSDWRAAGSPVIPPGIAVPHVTIGGEDQFALLLARSREGIVFAGEEQPVHTIFAVVNTPDERNFYLRSLAAISKVIQARDFQRQWMEATDPEMLRRLVRYSPRPSLAEIESGHQ
jgi:Kef-type K+ transport system membrane component KefB/mannitol/fructose-specific phosphotransferase system IIA component (Ntr-type)